MAQKIFIRTGNNYDMNAISIETGLSGFEKSLTQQHQKDEADINMIVKRFGLTGQLPSNIRMPSYGDFTDVIDYQSAMNAVKAAEESFMAMPAYVRNRFNNDPAKFVEFCSDEKNKDEAIKLGLVPQQKATEETPPAPPADGATKAQTPKA